IVFGTSIHGQSGLAGVNGGNRYGDTANCASVTSTFQNNEYVPVIMIDYTPAGGLFAGFSWTGSEANEIIQFNDQSYSSSTGGILAWSWDFGDGNTSSQQNPQHSYPCPGTYNVTLTVVDGIFNPSTVTLPVNIIDQSFSLVSTPGSGDLLITPPTASCYPSAVGGYTVYTLATVPGTFGNGPIFGITPDANTFAGIATARLPGSPQNFFVAPGVYPNVPFSLPPGTLGFWVGQTLDALVVYQDAGANLVYWSNVAQVTF
ncbi:MAG: PKD domain-containing protein, partial [Planctomycetes bacterium]|nr:PKD domain-containing protein [Planctomycetota bacterium]